MPLGALAAALTPAVHALQRDLQLAALRAALAAGLLRALRHLLQLLRGQVLRASGRRVSAHWVVWGATLPVGLPCSTYSTLSGLCCQTCLSNGTSGA